MKMYNIRGAGNIRVKAKQIILTCVLCISLVFSTAVLGHAYTSILAFGDSLSDDGGVSAGYGIIGFAPFTNGKVWVTDLADSSHLNLPLFDMAFGGATTGTSNPWAAMNGYPEYANTGLLWQVGDYLTYVHNQIPATTLVTMWAGANDLLYLYPETPKTAAGNVATALNELAAAGFKNFLVPGLPNIAGTLAAESWPYYERAYAAAWVPAFNSYLSLDLAGLKSEYPGDHFFTLDTYDLLDKVASDPTAYGFANFAAMFWIDGFHPSAQTHELIAGYAMAAATAPEPCTLLLLGSGLVGLAALRKKFSA
jgi:phospholipase/lecithinase/hemolysin